jgi:uncharacterized protein YcbX
MIKITELYCYPVKSLAGISLNHAELDTFGIKHDRRWLIVDEMGKFITQRTHPKMALIKTSFVEEQLQLSFKGQTIKVPIVSEKNNEIFVTVWKDSFHAKHVCQDVDRFLSEIIGTACKIVYMNPEVQRQIDEDYAPKQQFVSFADAFPFLITSQASLRELNQHLDQKAEMSRFRPNIVIEGNKAYSEDHFNEMSINQVELRAVKKCSRCPMPTINQQTGKKDNKQILTVLNQTRKENNKVYFGQNLIYKNPNKVEKSTLNIGDELILK